MKQGRKLIVSAAACFDLPADIVAGLPRMEMVGTVRFSMEPHKGLLEYSAERVVVDSVIGNVTVTGNDLTLQYMSREKIAVSGKIKAVAVGEEELE